MSNKIIIREEGPREIFQLNAPLASSDQKLRLIEALSQTGIKSIQVTSFVSPKVPWHQDAEEISQKLKKINGVSFNALYIHPRGLEKALQFEKLKLEGIICGAATPGFLKANYGLNSIEQASIRAEEILKILKLNNINFNRLMVSTAWGNKNEDVTINQVFKFCDAIIKVATKLEMRLEEITLADTPGLASPEKILTLVKEMKSRYENQEIGLHLHGERNRSIENAEAGFQAGVRRFDTVVAGFGGCPMTKSIGNISSTDLVRLVESKGIETGINIAKYEQCEQLAKEIVSKAKSAARI